MLLTAATLLVSLITLQCMTALQCLAIQLKFPVPFDTKIGHARDVVMRQSLSLVLKKLNNNVIYQ